MELNKVPGYTRALARGYRLEESYREYSYLDAPEFICGVEVRPLTLQMYLQLSTARSPFLVGGRRPCIQDVGVFLFRLSPAYDAAFKAKADCRSQIADCRLLPRKVLIRIARDNALLPRFSIFNLQTALCNRRRSSLVTLLEQNVEAIAQNAFNRSRRQFLEVILFFDFQEGYRRAVRAIDRFLDRMFLDKPIRLKQPNPSLDPPDICFVEEVIHLIAGARRWSRHDILRMPMPEIFQALRKIQRDDPNCPPRTKTKVHPFASRLTRKHRAIAEAAAITAAAHRVECS